MNTAYDVVVVGYGAAGAAAAVEAADHGASVLLVEKAEHPGGNTVLSGGFCRVARDAKAASAYLDRTSGGRVGQALVRALAAGMVELPAYLRRLARPLGASVGVRFGSEQAPYETSDLYAWPGRETLGWAGVESIPGFDGYPWVQFGGHGQQLMRLLEASVERRAVDVRLRATVRRLLLDRGEVAGVVVDAGGREETVAAHGGVVLACGGFEFDAEMIRDYLAIPVLFPIGHRGNTGDGVRMAQQAGAALWHMWLVHGSYGFRFPGWDVAFRNHLGGTRRNDRKLAWILVDQDGRRFTDEVHPAPQDTMARALAHLDAERGRFPRIPAWMVFDVAGRRLGPIARPTAAAPAPCYRWSDDNAAEVARGWITSAATISELARKTGLPGEALRRTVDRWNRMVRAGRDADHGRPAGTLMPVSEPPFHAVPVWPICSNTQGGPRHDEFQRVLDPAGQPIPSLYAAGELGSFFGHIYLLGGNLSEALAGGRIAGRRAAGSVNRGSRILPGAAGEHDGRHTA